jgi:hypothetical protein
MKKTARPRRLGLVLPIILAVRVAFLNLTDVWAHPYSVEIIQKSLSYANSTQYAAIDYAAYAVCTCCPSLLASDKYLRLFGMIITAGLIVSVAVHFAAFISIWCFFAAAGSVTVYWYFANLSRVIAVRRLA